MLTRYPLLPQLLFHSGRMVTKFQDEMKYHFFKCLHQVPKSLCLSNTKLAWTVGVPVGQHSGSWLATTLVATKNLFIYFFRPPFFFSVATFFHRGSARIKKHILWKLTGASKNLGDAFKNPVCHFGTPSSHFEGGAVLQVVSESLQCR